MDTPRFAGFGDADVRVIRHRTPEIERISVFQAFSMGT
jgi:hypothetical protein